MTMTRSPSPTMRIAVAELGGKAHLHRAAQQPLQTYTCPPCPHGSWSRRPRCRCVPMSRMSPSVMVRSLSTTRPSRMRPVMARRTAAGCSYDLLEHEVVIAALFRGVHVPVDVVVLLVDGAAALVVDADALRRDDGQLAVVHVDHVPGVAQQRRHVRGQKILSLVRSPAAAARPSGRR